MSSNLCRFVVCAAILAVTSCAAPPQSVPPPQYAADGRLDPPDRILVMSDNAHLPLRVWRAAGRPDAVVLALHGFNESRDAWETSGPWFARRGITGWAPDQRGFGAAPDRGGWAGSARMEQDAREILAMLGQENPGVPVYLMGESMGGAVALALMGSHAPPAVSGAILLSPAVWRLGFGADSLLRVLSTVAPGARFTGQELPVHVLASDNIAALRRMYFDPLTLRATRLEAVQGLVALMDEAARAAPDVRAPMLVLYGDKDQLVPQAATAATWALLPGFVRRDMVPGGYHLLLRGRNGGQALADVASWIHDPGVMLPSGGDSAAAAWFAGQGWEGQVFPLLPSRIDGLVGR